MSTVNKNKLIRKTLSAGDLGLEKGSILDAANASFNKNLANVPQPGQEGGKEAAPEAKETAVAPAIQNNEVTEAVVPEPAPVVTPENTQTTITGHKEPEKEKIETTAVSQENDQEEDRRKRRKRFLQFDELVSTSRNAKIEYSSNNNAKLTNSNLMFLKTIAANNKGTTVVSLLNIILEEAFKYYQEDIAELAQKNHEEMLKMLTKS